MLEQWIPRAIEAGWLKDITAEVGETHLLHKRVTPKTWAWWKKRSLFQLTDAQLPTGDFALPVMSVGAAREAIDRIPDGALILTVRQSRDAVPIVVTHLGFKVPSPPKVPMMRHATRMGSEPRVRNERLVWYLEHVQWYHRWPVEGVSILMPQEFGPTRPPRDGAEAQEAQEAQVARGGAAQPHGPVRGAPAATTARARSGRDRRTGRRSDRRAGPP